jgi:hypothetical protein
MDRTASVARTPTGKDNLNRLRVPEYGVKQITVKCGGKVSKSYQPPGAHNPPDTNNGTDGFHFAPEKESLEIDYEIVDPCGAIEGATLQLFRRYQQAPLWTLDLKTLGPTWWAHGKHSVKWDGRVVKADKAQDGTAGGQGMAHDLTKIAADTSLKPFPDGYVTVEYTAYKLKLTVTGGGVTGDPAIAWTYFHVLIEKIELEFGPEAVLPVAVPGKGDHRAVRKDVISQAATPPAASAGKTIKVYLDSDVYKNGANQMFNNTLHTVYGTLWGDGPLVPIFAKVTVQDSTGNGVQAPKALGTAKFLWDWESKRTASATGTHADSFINDAQDYDQNKTKPKGLNAHKDRKGKRGAGASAVFPAQAGYDAKDVLDDGKFPFKVEPVPTKRKWAAYSYAWRDKALAGKTGVLFQPSRMAGDAYTLTVYLAWDVDENDKNLLDVDDDAPLVVPEPKKVAVSTGVFEVWRRTHLRKYLKKRTAGVPALNLGTIAGCYTSSFMALEDASGGGKVVSTANWNAGITNAISGWSAAEKLTVDAAVNQHTVGPEGVHFRGRAQFIVAWKIQNIKAREVAIGVPAADADTIANAAGAAASEAAAGTTAATQAQGIGYNATDQTNIANAAKAGWKYIDDYMANPANNVNDNRKYAEWLQDKAIAALESLFDGRFDAGDGVTIFQSERSHNLTGFMASITIGLAYDFPSVQVAGNPTRCGFLLMSKAGDVACGLEKISGHEIGHHYFLPHPTDTAEKQDYSAHDKIVPSKCLMSYNFALPMVLCGFCELRLRGWDKSQLDPDGPKNKQT